MLEMSEGSSRKGPTPRDQDPSPFSAVLDWLCQRTGAHGAAFVDAEGETVDYGGRLAPFDVRVLAAELRLVQQGLAQTKVLAHAHELVVRARKKSFLLQVLPEGYALVLELPRCASGVSKRALALGVRRLCAEAGFEPPERFRVSWREIDIKELPGGSHRPTAALMGGVEASLIVLGRLAAPPTSSLGSEKGFRVRLGTGQEGNLIREPLGHWYLEEE